MESKIIIRNIDVYDDVTMAQVLLQAEGQEKGNKFLHRVPHPFLCNMNFDR